MITAADLSRGLIARADERAKNPHIVWGLSWGFPGIDKATGGIYLPMFAILAGPPSVGKSAWAGQVMAAVAEQLAGTDKVVRVISLEMTPESWLHRVACAKAQVNAELIKTGFAKAEQRARYKKAADELARLPVEFVDHTESFNDIYHAIKDDGRTAFWIIDHMGIVPGALDPKNPTGSLIEVAKHLRRIGHHVAPGIALSQVTKEVTTRQDKRPLLSDVYGGMQVTGNADVVVGLYREDQYVRISADRKDKPLPAEMLVLKNRDGSTPLVESYFVPAVPAWVDKTEALEKLEAKMRRGE